MSLIRKFSTVGGATMVSRMLGFVREAMIAAALGAGPVADAFYAAFAFPNLFRRIFAEGAFNAAFIPLFAKKLESDDRSDARQFANDVASILIVILLLLSALAMLFMPALVGTVVAPYFADTPDKFDLTVLMTRIMFPYLACMSLVAMLSGILNSTRRYFVAAIVPVLLNVVLIAAIGIALFVGAGDVEIGLWLAWGVFAAGFAQLVLLFFAASRVGFTLKPHLPRPTPEVKQLIILMGPAVLTGGVLQINLMIGRIIASAQDGAITMLNLADRINQLPLGVIGIAIGVVLLPELSRALKAEDTAEAVHLQNRSLEFALALTLPATIGFLVMPQPIVSILYERGAFDAETAVLTAYALAAYAAGLPAYVMIKVFQPAFFAREDMKSPFRFSVVMVVVNIVGSLLLFPSYGHVGIAAATAISAWVNVGLLAWNLSRNGGFRPDKTVIKRVSSMIFASLVMGAGLLVALSLVASTFEAGGLLVRTLITLALIGCGAIVYFAILIVSGGIEVSRLKRLLRRG
ncbi:MAG: murein biosynthesis integral membrane protein MurJ [Pseudomonadota bacterium]